MVQVLAVSMSGQPFRWLTADEAIHYHAAEKVAWAVGATVLHYRGGYRVDGSRSELESAAIIAIRGSDIMAGLLRDRLPLGDRNELLFRRDRSICAYCGQQFGRADLTRDHVVPRSRGGADHWRNVVTACRACNVRKAARTPSSLTPRWPGPMARAVSPSAACLPVIARRCGGRRSSGR